VKDRRNQGTARGTQTKEQEKRIRGKTRRGVKSLLWETPKRRESVYWVLKATTKVGTGPMSSN